jgi:hypothetical protein
VRSAAAAASDGVAGVEAVGLTGGAPGTGEAMIPTAALAAVKDMVGDLVRVGGRVAAVDGDLLKLDDGTAQVLIRMTSGDDGIEPALRVGEVLNLTGMVRRPVGRGPEIIVRSLADIHRAAALRVTDPATPEPNSAFLSASATQPTDDGSPTALVVPAPSAVPSEALVAGGILAAASAFLGLVGLRLWRRSRAADRA